MQITTTWLHTWFDTFNRDYFDGALPLPHLAISKSRTRLGSMSYKRKMSWGRPKQFDYAIRISNYYDQSEQAFQNVLLHEMIHYYIAHQGIRDTSPHGTVFQKIMYRLNTEHGWQITVSSEMELARHANSVFDKENHLILVVEIEARGCFLSVVNPRYAPSITRKLQADRHVKRLEWYTSADTYFAGFPAVRSPRGQKISPEQLTELGGKMQRIGPAPFQQK